MKKTLYSLMLNDDVVREVDLLAHQRGTSRSSLINEILADYVEVMTPERWINQVFKTVEQLLAPSRELVPFFVPNTSSMSVKSSLQYKYRPTVKYEVEFHSLSNDSNGELSVIFRTQSGELIRAMTNFFRLWKQTEDRWLTAHNLSPRQYELYDGRFVRSLSVAEQDLNHPKMAQSIVDYVETFDRLMKAYLANNLTPEQLSDAYDQAMEQQAVIF